MISNDTFQAIDALDLDQIKSKLMHVQSGEGWDQAKADAVETEYRRFLYLLKAFPEAEVAPLEDVDTFWHYHILDTMKYAADCEKAFGFFVHHVPSTGTYSDEDRLELDACGERMRDLYESVFELPYGESLALLDGGAAGEGEQGNTESSWCMRGIETAANTAWCMRGTETAAKAAWCMRGTETAAKAAWCMRGTETSAKAAWCMRGTETAAKTAWCMRGSETAAKAAWCMRGKDNSASSTSSIRVSEKSAKSAWCMRATQTSASSSVQSGEQRAKAAWCMRGTESGASPALSLKLAKTTAPSAWCMRATEAPVKAAWCMRGKTDAQLMAA